MQVKPVIQIKKRTYVQFPNAIYFTRILGFISYIFWVLFIWGWLCLYTPFKFVLCFLGIKGVVLFCNVHEFFRDNRFLRTLHCKMCISTLLIHFCTKIARLRTLVANSNQVIGELKFNKSCKTSPWYWILYLYWQYHNEYLNNVK